MTIPPPGTVVAWWEHDAIAFGVVVTEEKQRVVLVTADGREERVAPARVVASLASGPAPGRTPEGRREAAAASPLRCPRASTSSTARCGWTMCWFPGTAFS